MLPSQSTSAGPSNTTTAAAVSDSAGIHSTSDTEDVPTAATGPPASTAFVKRDGTKKVALNARKSSARVKGAATKKATEEAEARAVRADDDMSHSRRW